MKYQNNATQSNATQHNATQQNTIQYKAIYRQTFNLRRTLVDNMIVDNSDAVGASPDGSNYIFSTYSIAGFNGLGTDNWKTRWETFKFWNLVRLILERVYGNIYTWCD